MSQTEFTTGKILLLGLEDPSLAALGNILAEQSHSVRSEPLSDSERSFDALADAQVVCCPAEPRHYNSVVRRMRGSGSTAPVVVVSSSSDIHEWLDAIEAGAWDYLSAPFEPNHIQHVVENALRCVGNG